MTSSGQPRRAPTRAIDEFQAGPRTAEAVEAFIAGHSFPIVEGEAITFVHRGEAEAVHLKHWVYGLPSSQQLARIEGTDLWYLTLELPAGSRVVAVLSGGNVNLDALRGLSWN